MPTDRSILGLVIETKTIGQQEIDKLTGSFNKLADAVDKSGNKVKEQADSAQATANKWKTAIQNPIESATGAAESFVLKYGKVGVALTAGAAVAAAGAAVLARWSAQQGAAAEASINFADRLGISVGRAQQWQAQMRIAGVSADSLEGSVRALSAALEDPTGAGAKAVETLRALGVQTRTTSGEQRELGPVLEDVVRKLAGISSDSERAATAQRLLGRGAAVELLPWIKNLGDLDEAVKRLGIGLDESGTRKLAEFDDEIGKAQEAWEEFKRSISAKLAPIEIAILGSLNGSQPGRFIDIPGAITRQNVGSTNRADTDLVGRFLGSRSTGASSPFSSDAAFQRYLNSTDRGLQLRLQKAQEDLKKAEGDIKTAVNEAQASEAVKRATSLAATVKAIQKQIADIAKEPYKDVRASVNDILNIRPAGVAQVDPLNSQLRVQRAIESASEINAEVQKIADQFEAINDVVAKATGGELEYVSGLAERIDAITVSLDKIGKVDPAVLDAQIRITQLGQNEYQVARDVLALKLQAARSTEEAKQAELDYTVRIAEIERQRIDQFKEQARGVFRAALQGGSGINALARTTGNQLLEQVFVNASGKLFQSTGSTLGKLGEASGLGGLLKGTLFDPQNANPIVNNSTVTQQNTLATVALTRAMGGGVGFSGGGSTNSLLGAIEKLPSIFGSRAGIPASTIDMRELPLNSGLGGVSSAGSRFSFGKAAGIGGALAAGTFGAIAGFNQGGAQGGLLGTASIASTAGVLLPMLSKSLSVAGPIGLIAGLGLSLLSGFLPNPKKKFDEAQNATLKSRQFTGADAMSQDYDVATVGQNISTDFKGRTRVVVQQVININALDYQSLATRKEDLAKVIGDAAREGNPDMVLGINSVAFGPGAA